ncbi:13E12 repeat family protein [Gordonia sputi]|uniref:DUF222 domain-containing protein n=1 Tax=Gordonia sputi TaxID=36823 RepID=UPI002044C0D5|nr:DUF222 domain-containing protein [Gordonia sputi]MCM3896818.1 13E12 repeat family protein [Gordonia sputi]
MSINSVGPGAGSGAGAGDSEGFDSTSGAVLSDWASALPLGLLGGVDPAAPDGSDTVAVLEGLTRLRCGEAFLAWARYQSIGVLYDRLVVERAASDGLIVDGFSDAAARISGIFAVSRPQAERMIDEAIVLRDDLPQVFGCLREGIISIEQARLVISRTDLVRGPDTPSEVVAAVDEQIATTLRTRRGSWKRPRLRDMVDRIVFRHDPDAIRERRARALDKRGVFTDNCGDGVGEITAVMSAENVAIAVAAVRRLADAVCDGDGRTRQQRASDAMFALLSGSRFECACDSTDCVATIPEPGTVPPADPRFVIHVVCNEAALIATETHTTTAEPADSTTRPAAGAAESGARRADSAAGDAESAEGGDSDRETDSDDGPRTWTARVDRPRLEVPDDDVPVGFMDGHGIISAEHVRDIAARPDAVIHRVVPTNIAENADGTFTLPAHGTDPYRPSTALDEAVRCRDGYCVDPGCSHSAWTADNDHVTEYDHHTPAAGGSTSYENLNTKCRYGHITKTFGDWVDDQYRDPVTGRLVTEYITPEGFVIPGDAETFEDTFPGLRRLRFTPPDTGDPPPRRIEPPETTPRRHTRATNKHARRRAERHRNRQRRLTRDVDKSLVDNAAGPPPF